MKKYKRQFMKWLYIQIQKWFQMQSSSDIKCTSCGTWHSTSMITHEGEPNITIQGDRMIWVCETCNHTSLWNLDLAPFPVPESIIDNAGAHY